MPDGICTGLKRLRKVGGQVDMHEAQPLAPVKGVLHVCRSYMICIVLACTNGCTCSSQCDLHTYSCCLLNICWAALANSLRRHHAGGK